MSVLADRPGHDDPPLRPDLSAFEGFLKKCGIPPIRKLLQTLKKGGCALFGSYAHRSLPAHPSGRRSEPSPQYRPHLVGVRRPQGNGQGALPLPQHRPQVGETLSEARRSRPCGLFPPSSPQPLPHPTGGGEAGAFPEPGAGLAQEAPLPRPGAPKGNGQAHLKIWEKVRRRGESGTPSALRTGPGKKRSRSGQPRWTLNARDGLRALG